MSPAQLKQVMSSALNIISRAISSINLKTAVIRAKLQSTQRKQRLETRRDLTNLVAQILTATVTRREIIDALAWAEKNCIILADKFKEYNP